MSKVYRQTGRKYSSSKENISLEMLNTKRIEFISQNMTHDYVRCLVKDGSVYCGYIRSMDKKLTSFVLYYPYIEKSPTQHTQPALNNEITIQFSDVLKMTTHKTVSSAPEEAEPETLSRGILDSLALSAMIEEPKASTFDDSERRQRAKYTQKSRELKSDFEFIVETEGKGLDEEEYRKGQYDQFQANKEKFGVRSDFDISLYTVNVDSSEIPLELRDEAARMELEMKSSGSSNAHVLEERGVAISVAEEDLYSKVQVTEAPQKIRRRLAPVKEDKHPAKEAGHAQPVKPAQPVKEVAKEVVKEVAKEVAKEAAFPAQPTPAKEETKKDTRLSASAPEFVFKPSTNARMVPIIPTPMMPVYLPPNQMMMRGQVMPVQVMPMQPMPGQQPGQQVMHAYPVQYQMMPPVYNGQYVIQQPFAVMPGQTAQSMQSTQSTQSVQPVQPVQPK